MGRIARQLAPYKKQMILVALVVLSRWARGVLRDWEAQRAEVLALRAQISPHFIYNALNTIASFVRTDPARARELLLEFADFTRYALRRDGAFTTVSEELRNVERYLVLEQARFGERLGITLKIAPEVLAALRLGAYQLLYTRVDDHAAVDTSVRLVEAAGAGQAKGFANAILRTITRTPAEQWLDDLTPSDPVAAVAFRTAHPEWISRSFGTALGASGAEGELEAALEADSQRPVVHLVARPGEISAAELAAMPTAAVAAS